MIPADTVVYNVTHKKLNIQLKGVSTHKGGGLYFCNLHSWYSYDAGIDYNSAHAARPDPMDVVDADWAHNVSAYSIYTRRAAPSLQMVTDSHNSEYSEWFTGFSGTTTAG